MKIFKSIVVVTLSFVFAACSGGNGSKHGEPLESVGDAAPVLASNSLASNSEPLDLLIFGGTSGIGLETTKLALSRGHKVTSITRRPERMELEHENLENLKGDITKLETFSSLLEGKDAVISAIGLKPSSDKITVYSDGMRNVLQGLGENNSTHVVTITGIGAGDSKGHGGFFYDRILNPFLLKEDYADKTRQEKVLQSSAASWTIVRPGFLTDDISEAKYRVLKEMDGVVSGDISRADVAHFLLGVVEQGSYVSCSDTVFLSN